MSNFKVKMCLNFWGAPEFASELADEIAQNSYRLGLDEHCDKGGSPDVYVEIEELEFDEVDDGIIEGDFSISFSESYYGGCRDIDWKQKYSGSMTFRMIVDTGEIEITDSEIVEDEEEQENE